VQPPARAREAGDRPRGGGDGPGRRGPSPSTASTTAYYLALQLRRKRELVVVTSGLLIASALAEAPGISVVVTGGILRRATLSVVRGLAGDVLRTTRIDKGFFGARGLRLEHGLMDLNPEEVRLKRVLVAACGRWSGSSTQEVVPNGPARLRPARARERDRHRRRGTTGARGRLARPRRDGRDG